MNRATPAPARAEAAGLPAHSEHLNKIALALVAVQEQLGPVRADEVGTIDDGIEERTYRYATLTSVWAAVRPLLAQHGLAVVQTCEPGQPKELRLVTMLLHSSGQWIAGTTAIPVEVQTAQGYGSALTYARRYGLAAIVGLSVEHDDDGAEASRRRIASDQSDTTLDRAAAAVNGDAWWKVPCAEAAAPHWEAFMVAYARATQVPSANRDDVCRDFDIEDGGLIDHFGNTPLGEIVARGRAVHRRKASPTARDSNTDEPQAA